MSSVDKEAAHFAAAELERLISLPLKTTEDVLRWDIEAANFETDLEKRFPNFDLEHEVGHWIIDSDIRQKQDGYRQRQNQIVTDYILRLRQQL